MTGASIVWLIDAATREAMLFAAVGFLIGGIDDLLIDAVFLMRHFWCWRTPRLVADLPHPAMPGRLAIFVPAWDESTVIGAMLRTALARLDHPNYRLYVGCYPNDRATIDAVAGVAEQDARVRIVIGARSGPTTKADCLNVLWQTLLRDDALAGQRTRAVILHDAEDVVHPAELRVYDALLDDHAIVQIPVLPLVDRRAPLVSGHYADEFADGHLRQMVVRHAVGAGLPLAGVGCAISVDALDHVSRLHGAPFDGTSLTEDYEFGLRVATLGLSTCFARLREYAGGPVVAVRAYFPAKISAAVLQKSRWITGIALAGWDRTGWGRPLHFSDHWMRMRDRRAPIAVIVLAVGYCAILAWALSIAVHWAAGTEPGPWSAAIVLLLWVNAALLAWRLMARAAITTYCYGWREGLWAVPRAFVGNVIALLAARRAMLRYAAILAGATPQWDKTAHVFPITPEDVT